MQVSIYGLEDPRTNLIRYVGKARKVERRYYEHCHVGSPNRKMRNWIEDLSRLGLVPTLRVLEVTTDEQSRERERFWIAQYPGQLLNAIRV